MTKIFVTLRQNLIIMKSFFKIFFACLLAIVVSSVINVFLWGMVMVAIISSAIPSSDEEVKMSGNVVLKVDLSNAIVDRPSLNPMQDIDLMTMKSKKSMTLLNAVSLIEAAKGDPGIKGIHLEVPMEPAVSMTSLYELRQALVDFRQSGKFVIAYADVYSQAGYYIASCADKIYLNPQGGMQWSGMSASVMFYKGLFDKLGIQPEVIKHGKFKGAVEPLVLDKLSAENRLQMESLIGSMWGYVVGEIARSRSIDSTLLQQYANESAVQFPSEALKYSFVDSLFYRDQLLAELSRLTQNEKPQSLTLGQYLAINPSISSGDVLAKDKVSVIYAQGDIMDSGDAETAIIGNNMAGQIRALREDETVKAVVLRVNSPGGSALASDVIWREVELTKRVKPIIVSMGSYAASGGYYMSCAADKIVAAPTTLTGSIGVFGVMFNVEKGAREKLGVTVDVVKTNTMADAGNIFRPLTPIEQQLMQAGVDTIYNHFTSVVAEGRDMSVESVDEIAQGRVWSGLQAVDNRLVDRIGGLKEAIALAAESAALNSYRVDEYPKSNDSFMSMFMGLMEASVLEIKSSLGVVPQQIDKAEQTIKRFEGVNVRMPYDLEIK